MDNADTAPGPMPAAAPAKSPLPLAWATTIVVFLAFSGLARWVVSALGLASPEDQLFGAQEWALAAAFFLSALCGTLMARGRFLLAALLLWALPFGAFALLFYGAFSSDLARLMPPARLVLAVLASTLAPTLAGVLAGKWVGRQWLARRTARAAVPLPPGPSDAAAPLAPSAARAFGQWWRVVLTFALAGPPIGSLATLGYYCVDALGSGVDLNGWALLPSALVFAAYSFGVGFIPAIVVGACYASLVVRGGGQRGNAIGRVLFATALGAAVGALVGSLGFADPLWIFLPCLVATPACAWLAGRHARA